MTDKAESEPLSLLAAIKRYGDSAARDRLADAWKACRDEGLLEHPFQYDVGVADLPADDALLGRWGAAREAVLAPLMAMLRSGALIAYGIACPHTPQSQLTAIDSALWRGALALNARDGTAVSRQSGDPMFTALEFRSPRKPPHGDVSNSAAPAPLSPKKNKGGRPVEYDWPAFDREMMRLANTPDGLGERAEVMRKMQEWCSTNWNKEPTESMVRDRIASRWPD